MNPKDTIPKTLLAAAISSVLMLQGCSDTTNDAGVAAIQPNGAVVDDYIAFSRIYVDANNNNTFDSDREPYAYTDANGQFGGEYCKNPYDPLSYKFCLNIPENLADKPIRVEGGRDILTGMEYEGTMSMQLDGETQDLAITSFSTLKEVLSSFDTNKFTNTGIDASKYQNIDIEQLINELVTEGDAVAQFELGQSLNKQNLLSTRTSFSTFKQGIAIHKVAEIIAAYLKQQDNGKYLRTYMPAIYAAIAANFKADQGNIYKTTFENIINESAQLNGLGPLNASEIAQAAFNIYTFNTEQQKPDNDTADTRRIPLAKAEILTQSAKKAVESGNTNKARTITETLKDNNLGTLIKDETSFQKLDFETAAEKISKSDETDIENTISNLGEGEDSLKDFVTKVIGANQYIELTENENNAKKIIKAYFQETEQNDTQHKGKITLCAYDSSKDPDERAAIFTGNWAWDELKTYQLRAEALGVQVSIEHLNPDLHSGTDECNGDSTTIKTCLRVTTPQIGEQAAQIQYFTSTEYYLSDEGDANNDIDALIEAGKNAAENTDDVAILIKDLGTDNRTPENVNQCFPDEDL